MSIEFSFPKTAEEVFDLLCDPDFLVERSIALGELSCDAETDEDDKGNVLVTMRRTVKRDLPSFLAKVFNPQQVITLNERWQQIGSNFIAKVTIEVEGQPVTIAADYTLKNNDAGCVFTAKYKPNVKIPLIGGKVEKFIQENLNTDAKKELQYTAKKLA